MGRATFADDVDDTGRSVVQVRGLAYPGACGLRATNDILRTSSGSLTQEGDLLTLTTRRTRYVFRRVAEAEAIATYFLSSNVHSQFEHNSSSATLRNT